MTKDKHISFYVKDQKDIKFLEKIQNNSQYFRNLVHKITIGEIDESDLTIKQQLDVQRMKKIMLQSDLLKQKIRVAKSYADFVEVHVERFDSFPSKSAMIALRSRAESTNKPKQILEKITYLPKFNFNKTHGTWFGMCKICPTSNFSANTETGIIEKLENHITEEHKQEPYDELKN